MKFEKGSIRHLLLSIVATDIFGFIVFPLFDWIITLFSKDTFKYSVKEHVIFPLIFCTIVAIVCWFFDRIKAKKK